MKCNGFLGLILFPLQNHRRRFQSPCLAGEKPRQKVPSGFSKDSEHLMILPEPPMLCASTGLNPDVYQSCQPGTGDKWMQAGWLELPTSQLPPQTRSWHPGDGAQHLVLGTAVFGLAHLAISRAPQYSAQACGGQLTAATTKRPCPSLPVRRG